MIPRIPFGRTGHDSTRVIFGSYALDQTTQTQADRILPLLLKHGINHIDTAPLYGNAEKRLGPWLAKHRDEFFIATKTRQRSRLGALNNLKQSLRKLRVDYIDLWQMHGLTNPAGWEKAMGPNGALEAFIEAREQGLVRFLGVTGHGTKVAGMHIRSLKRFDFDSVLLPYNYVQMLNSKYAADFKELMKICESRKVAVQTIKSVAARPWGNRPKTHNTYFYEPIEDQSAIDVAVHWALGLPDSFLITAGDMQVLPKVLEAATRFKESPAGSQMRAIVDKVGLQPLFR